MVINILDLKQRRISSEKRKIANKFFRYYKIEGTPLIIL